MVLYREGPRASAGPRTPPARPHGPDLMASPRQLRANRLNALKSTGPKTDEGKERSRENALTHGLTARVVRPLHEHEEAERLVDHWRVSLRPMTNFDEHLLEQVATAA